MSTDSKVDWEAEYKKSQLSIKELIKMVNLQQQHIQKLEDRIEDYQNDFGLQMTNYEDTFNPNQLSLDLSFDDPDGYDWGEIRSH